jgi:hypothetical protein
MSDVATVVPQAPNNGLVATSAALQIVEPDYRPNSVAMPILSLKVAIERRKMVMEYVTEMFVPGVDFHEIPGTNREGEPAKKVLSKAGAENLCSFFGLRPQFSVAERDYDIIGDRYGEARYYVRYKCLLIKNDEVMGDGEGSCNSWESKYHYRWVSADTAAMYGYDPEKLPKRGDFIIEPEFAVKKAETGGKYGKPAEYWKAFEDAIGNGTATKVQRKKKDGGFMDAWQIGSFVYRIPNPDVSDIINTVEKMAQKRALIAAVLIATGISGMFTQDLEDLQEPPEVRVGTPMDASPTETPKQPAPQQQTAKQETKPEPPKKQEKTANPKVLELQQRVAKLAEHYGLSVEVFQRQHSGPFLHGYFAVAPGHKLPVDLALYDAPIKVLETLTEEQQGEFLSDSGAFGKHVVEQAAKQVVEGTVVKPTEAPKAEASGFSASTLIPAVAKFRNCEPAKVTALLAEVGITPDTPQADTIAYLRLLATIKPAKIAMTAAKNNNTTVADVLAKVEAQLGGAIEAAEPQAVEHALMLVASGE